MPCTPRRTKEAIVMTRETEEVQNPAACIYNLPDVCVYDRVTHFYFSATPQVIMVWPCLSSRYATKVILWRTADGRPSRRTGRQRKPSRNNINECVKTQFHRCYVLQTTEVDGRPLERRPEFHIDA